MLNPLRLVRKPIIIILIFCLFSSACQATPAVSGDTPSPEISQIPTELPTHAPTATTTASLTPSATPTQTHSPTATHTPTLIPTHTPSVTPTAYGGYRPGQLVAYVVDGNAVMVNHVDGSQPVNVSKGIEVGRPALLGWSSDGQWVFFTESTMCSGICEFTHLWAARPDGSEFRTVYTNPTDSRQITWKPDDTTFIFTCNANDPADLDAGRNKYFCSGNVEDFTITPLGIEGLDPQYSPNGNLMAWVFSSPDRSHASNLMVLEGNQSEPVNVITYRNWIASEFRWLPDNRTIIYVERLNNSSCDIYQIDYTDPVPVLLLNLDGCHQQLGSLIGEASPDGRYLVHYYQDRANILDLNSPGTTVRVPGYRNVRLHWSPDGKLIGLIGGLRAMLIDPASGTVSTPDPSDPWYQVSAWAPADWYFYYQAFLQP